MACGKSFSQTGKLRRSLWAYAFGFWAVGSFGSSSTMVIFAFVYAH